MLSASRVVEPAAYPPGMEGGLCVSCRLWVMLLLLGVTDGLWPPLW